MSIFGDTFFDYVLLVLSVTLSGPLTPGGVGAVMALPTIFAGVWGALADKFPRLRGVFIVACEGAAGIVACALAVAMQLLGTAVWEILAYLSIFVIVALTAGSNTILLASVPEIIEDTSADAQKRAAARMSTQGPLANALGPPAAAAASALLSAPLLVAADGLTSGVCALLMLPAARRIHRIWSKPSMAPTTEPIRGVFRPAVQGVRLLLADELLRAPILANAVSALLTYGLTFAIPLLVRQRHFANYYIALGMASMVTGTLAGSWVALRWRTDRALVTFLMLEPLVKAGAIAMILFFAGAWAMIIGLFLFCLPQGLARAARASLLTVRFPASSRGRVMGSYSTVIRFFLPIAPLVSQGLFAVSVKVYLGSLMGVLLLLGAILVSREPLHRARKANAAVAATPGRL